MNFACREHAGDYFCHVSNKHGEMVANMTVNVLFKPECKWNLNTDGTDSYNLLISLNL